MAVLEKRLREKASPWNWRRAPDASWPRPATTRYTARAALKRAIQKYLENPLARDILAGKFGSGQVIRAKREGEAIAFETAAAVIN